MEDVTTSHLAGEFKASSGLKYLGGFFVYGLAVSALYAGPGVGLPCPFRLLTGWECPLCGSTRMGAALLHFHLAAAFAFNPVVLIGLAVLSVLGALWTVEALGGPKVRPPQHLAERLRRVHPTRRLVIVMLLAVAYTVVRNLI
jgi:hypothetical protein